MQKKAAKIKPKKESVNPDLFKKPEQILQIERFYNIEVGIEIIRNKTLSNTYTTNSAGEIISLSLRGFIYKI